MEFLEFVLLLVLIFGCFSAIHFIAEKFFGISFYTNRRAMKSDNKSEHFYNIKITEFSSTNPKAMKSILLKMQKSRYKKTKKNVYIEIVDYKKKNPTKEYSNELIKIVEKAQREMSVDKENRRSEYISQLNDKIEKGELVIDEAGNMLDAFDKYSV